MAEDVDSRARRVFRAGEAKPTTAERMLLDRLREQVRQFPDSPVVFVTKEELVMLREYYVKCGISKNRPDWRHYAGKALEVVK